MNKQLCIRKVRDFDMALQARKVSGAFEKQAPVQEAGRALAEKRNKIIRSAVVGRWT